MKSIKYLISAKSLLAINLVYLYNYDLKNTLLFQFISLLIFKQFKLFSIKFHLLLLFVFYGLLILEYIRINIYMLNFIQLLIIFNIKFLFISDNICSKLLFICFNPFTNSNNKQIKENKHIRMSEFNNNNCLNNFNICKTKCIKDNSYNITISNNEFKSNFIAIDNSIKDIKTELNNFKNQKEIIINKFNSNKCLLDIYKKINEVHDKKQSILNTNNKLSFLNINNNFKTRNTKNNKLNNNNSSVYLSKILNSLNTENSIPFNYMMNLPQADSSFYKRKQNEFKKLCNKNLIKNNLKDSSFYSEDNSDLDSNFDYYNVYNIKD